jgi:hypothetical protein
MHKEGKNFFLINKKLDFAMNGFQQRYEPINLNGKIVLLENITAAQLIKK